MTDTNDTFDRMQEIMDAQLTEREMIIYLLTTGEDPMSLRNLARRLGTNHMNIQRTADTATKKLAARKEHLRKNS